MKQAIYMTLEHFLSRSLFTPVFPISLSRAVVCFDGCSLICPGNVYVLYIYKTLTLPVSDKRITAANARGCADCNNAPFNTFWIRSHYLRLLCILLYWMNAEPGGEKKNIKKTRTVANILHIIWVVEHSYRHIVRYVLGFWFFFSFACVQSRRWTRRKKLNLKPKILLKNTHPKSVDGKWFHFQIFFPGVVNG